MAHMKQFEHLKVQLDVIKEATKDFADESCIGKGGFGKVYKAKIDGHTTVAFKRLDPAFGQGDTEFWKEVMMLSQYKHENIVSLIGFCDDSGEKILVYPYAPKGSLDCHLNNDNLRWIERLKICIGAARGLEYLHSANGTQQRVLHRDIKSSNILLDEDWNAKISDFGLSKLGPANQEISFLYSHPVGTHGYVDPLYKDTGLLTKESDVYSFGVVLFEVLCGRLCIDYRNINPPLLALARQSYEQSTIHGIVYDNIKDEIKANSLMVFAKIAYRCLERNREERPLMTDIVEALETVLRYQDNNDAVANSYLPPENRVEDVGLVSESDGAGVLVVTIHRGFNLKLRRPYVGVLVGSDKQYTTAKNSKNPIWEESLRFGLEKPAEAELLLVVYSDSTMDKFLDKHILGHVRISVSDVVREKHMNDIYHIGNGRIHAELQFHFSARLPILSNQ